LAKELKIGAVVLRKSKPLLQKIAMLLMHQLAIRIVVQVVWIKEKDASIILEELLLS
jgi:hypothetical protein